jgi:tetratricopeptide (TPR) repeat protein
MSIGKNQIRDELMERAVALRNLGRYQDAVALLQPRAEILRRWAPAAGLLATLYFDLSDYANSARWFARAVKLAPHSERASLGLFHSLWELGQRDRAFGEMKRFLTSTESDEYSRILHDLKKELLTKSPSKRKRPATVPPSMTPARFSVEDRLSINAAEHAGLDWRQSRKLIALAALESQHA